MKPVQGARLVKGEHQHIHRYIFWRLYYGDQAVDDGISLRLQLIKSLIHAGYFLYI